MTSKAEMRAELELLCAGKPVFKCPPGKRPRWMKNRVEKETADIVIETVDASVAAAQAGDLAAAISA